MTPLVTICTPVYNGHKHIAKAIESILNQNYHNIQYLIIDDCSTDNTSDIIASYDDPRIEYVRRNQRKGEPYHEDMMHLMRGHFACIMAHDERFYEDRIKNLVARFQTDPSLVAVYDKGELIDEDENVISGSEYRGYERTIQCPVRNQEEALILSFAGNALDANALMKMQTFKDISEKGVLSNKKYRQCFDAYTQFVMFSSQKIDVVDKIQYKFMIRNDALSNDSSQLEKVIPKWFELISEMRISMSIEKIFPQILNSDTQEEENRMRGLSHLYIAKLMVRNDAGCYYYLSVIENDLEWAISYNLFSSNSWEKLSEIRQRIALKYFKAARESMQVAWSLFPNNLKLQNRLYDLCKGEKQNIQNITIEKVSQKQISEFDYKHQTQWDTLNNSVKISSLNSQQIKNELVENRQNRYQIFAKSKLRPLIVSAFFPPHHLDSEDELLERLYDCFLAQKVPVRILVSNYIANSYARFDFEPIPQAGIYRDLILEESVQKPLVSEINQNNVDSIKQLVTQFQPNVIIHWDLKLFGKVLKTELNSLDIHTLSKNDLLSTIDFSQINKSENILNLLKLLPN